MAVPGSTSIKPDKIHAIAAEPFDHVARLAATVLAAPLASVHFAGERLSGRICAGALDIADRQHPIEQWLCQYVIDSGERLVIDDVRLDPHTIARRPIEPGNVIAWAGFPVRDPDGRVVGALSGADHLPRQWTTGDIGVLQNLADVAASEVALQVALQQGAKRAALARILQESLLPARLPKIPGLQVAARYMAGGTGVA